MLGGISDTKNRIRILSELANAGNKAAEDEIVEQIVARDDLSALEAALKYGFNIESSNLISRCRERTIQCAQFIENWAAPQAKTA